MPELSIITVNYNNREGLRRTVLSVIGQTFSNFEFIIVDGGSTDGSVDVIRSNQQRVDHWVSEKDGGIYNAQNKGIKAAKGKYLLFLNSGDFLCSKETLSEVFRKEHSEDIVYGDMRINWGNNSISVGKSPASISLEHMVNDTLWHPVSFIKRSLFEDFGMYDETYRLVADYEFFFRTIIHHKVTTRHIDVIVAEFDTGGVSSSPANKKSEKEERQRVLEKYLSPEEIKRSQRTAERSRNIISRIIRKITGKS